MHLTRKLSQWAAKYDKRGQLRQSLKFTGCHVEKLFHNHPITPLFMVTMETTITVTVVIPTKVVLIASTGGQQSAVSSKQMHTTFTGEPHMTRAGGSSVVRPCPVWQSWVWSALGSVRVLSLPRNQPWLSCCRRWPLPPLPARRRS